MGAITETATSSAGMSSVIISIITTAKTGKIATAKTRTSAVTNKDILLYTTKGYSADFFYYEY